VVRRRRHKGQLSASFNYDRLKKDLGVPLDLVPAMLEHYFGVKVCRATVYFWFSRSSMPLDRLVLLLDLARVHHKRRYDVWRYIVTQKPKSKAA
jgi:hypothetical protein